MPATVEGNMQTPDSRSRFLAALAAHLACSDGESEELLRGLRALGHNGSVTPPPPLELLELLSTHASPELAQFQDTCRRSVLAQACALHALRCGGEWEAPPAADPELQALADALPCGWRDDAGRITRAETLLRLLRDYHLLRHLQEPALFALEERLLGEINAQRQLLGSDPVFFRELLPPPALFPLFFRTLALARFNQATARAAALVTGTAGAAGAAEPLDELLVLRMIEQHADARSTQEQRRRWLHLAASTESPRAARTLLQLVQTPAEEERALVLLALRFGETQFNTWGAWQESLRQTAGAAADQERTCAALVDQYTPEAVLEWARRVPGIGPGQLKDLETWILAQVPRMPTQEFLDRWRSELDEGVCRRLQEQQERLNSPALPPPLPPSFRSKAGVRAATPPPLPSVPQVREGGEPGRVSKPSLPAPPPAPREPSLWEAHVQPFIASNWYIFAGTAMVLLGASLLAYFTWDKHWVLRYTLVPALLALLTESFAAAGQWLEKQSSRFRSTAIMLRTGAVALLPLNFLAAGLLGRDPDVTARSAAAACLLALYLAFFGWRVRRWCEGVSPGLAGVFSAALVLLSSLVAVLPAVASAGNAGSTAVVLTTGLYAGFAGLAWTAWKLLRRDLDPKLVAERVVPWFAGGALTMTFLQVFAWVHWLTGTLPRASTYALLAVAAGALVLYMERRFLQLRDSGTLYSSESFLGYALLLLGVLLGAPDPALRVASLAAAGAVWLGQASRRRGQLHYWIGLSMLMLAAGAVGLLPRFPRGTQLNGLPLLGIATAVVFSLLAHAARFLKKPRLADAAAHFQPAVLLVTAVVSVLSQWHYRSAPLPVGGVLGGCALLLLWGAWRLQRPSLAHAAMAVAALALPYLGCVDMHGRTLHGNTMVFGLAVLSAAWLAFVALARLPLFVQVRSTVLWIYGFLALAAMIFRVTVEQGTPGDLSWVRGVLDYAGPFLMAAVLVLAAWFSRSLLPSFMAIGIVLVLFPELRERFRTLIPDVTWGSGLGSAVGAVAAAALCFPIRRTKRLQNLDEGDRFLGNIPFPLQRRDSSLFEIPLLVSAIFLAAKVDFWTAFQRLRAGDPDVRTVTALGLTAVAWMLLAVVRRSGPEAGLFVALSWIASYEAFHFGLPGLITQPFRPSALLALLLVVQATWAAGHLLRRTRPWAEELLVAPSLDLLDKGGRLVAAGGVVWLLLGNPFQQVRWLLLFAGVQLVWHGLRRSALSCGVELFLLASVVILAHWTPGQGVLLLRLDLLSAFVPMLMFAAGIQALLLALEWSPGARQCLVPLSRPFQGGSAMLLAGLACALGAAWASGRGPELPGIWTALVAASLLAAARANASAFLLLLTGALAYVWVHLPYLAGTSPADRAGTLLNPVHLALLALALVALVQAHGVLAARLPRLLRGPDPLPGLASSSRWIAVPAGLLSLAALALHSAEPSWRLDPFQLRAPYMAAGALIWLTILRFEPGLLILSVAGLGAANLHLTYRLASGRLEAWGMSDIHLVCVALLLTLLQGTSLRLLLRREEVVKPAGRASLVLACAILVLLSAAYLAHPDLASMQTPRFVLSGLLALGAGYYFRRAARRETELPATRAVSQSFYHFGVTVAVWCAALAVPALRSPYTALVALGVPALYFYLRAELDRSAGDEEEHAPAASNMHGYRTSCAVLSLLLLAMYALRPVFQMVLFPEHPFQLAHYHWNAPLALLLAGLLLRLHRLGGHPWLAFYGGLSLTGGLYFALTAFPGLSPFASPVAAAWAAVTLAHFLIAAGWHHSPLRVLMQRLGHLSDEQWAALAPGWLRCLLAGTQLLIVSGLLESFTRHASSLHFAPLLIGSASVFAHHGIRRERSWSLALAGLAAVGALHADFLLPSLLPQELVVWVLLAGWAGALAAAGFTRNAFDPARLAPLSAVVFLLCAAHVWHLGPGSAAGLAATCAIVVLAALTPRATPQPHSAAEHFCAFLFPLAAPWLVFFALEPGRYLPRLLVWPLLAAVATAVAGVFLLRFYGSRIRAWIEEATRQQPRLVTQSAVYLTQRQLPVQVLVLGGAFVFSSCLAFFYRSAPFAPREAVMIGAIWAGCAAGFFLVGRDTRSPAPYYVSQLALLAVFLFVRRQLMLAGGFWNLEYDVWASLAASALLAGARPGLEKAAPGMRQSLAGSLFALPAAALASVFFHGLGTDIALVVMGLYSLVFAFLGRNNRHSPYNFVAVVSFTAFAVVLLWNRLGIHTLHSYTIPIGAAVLALVQLFGRDLRPDTRNQIRLVTLITMLGTAGYYALADARHPVGFNLVMLVLCLAAMGLGSLLRVRVYLLAGLCALLVDLASIGYKAVMGLDGTFRMTSIGALLLLAGAGVVGISVHYKAHEEEWEGRLARVRNLLGTWS